MGERCVLVALAGMMVDEGVWVDMVGVGDVGAMMVVR